MNAAQAGIAVLILSDGGGTTLLDHQLIGMASGLAAGTATITAIVVASSADRHVGQELIELGADEVVLAHHPSLHANVPEAWLPSLVERIAAPPLRLILMGVDAVAADLAPRLAFRLNGGIASNCVAARRENDRDVFTRPCYGGKALEEVSFRVEPVVATVRAGTGVAPERDGARKGSVSELPLELDAAAAGRCAVRGRRAMEHAGAPLETARVVVAGGRGLQGAQGFEQAAELAAALGGVLGASRAACDAGWCSLSRQIGLSGRTVAPELYIALGISGAPQHMSGCAGARTIVAVNSDPDAPIFKYASYGAVADCGELVPALTAAITQRPG